MTTSGPATTSPPLPEQAEIDSIQAAAKWLVAAAAAVFAAVAAGVQLSALGQLTAQDPVRFGVAVGASILALAATAVILGQAVRVLVHPGWTLQKLAHMVGEGTWRQHWLKDQLEGQRGMLGTGQPQVDPAQLYRHLGTLRDAETIFAERQSVEVVQYLDVKNSPKITYTSANISGLQQRVETAEEVAQRVAIAANVLSTRRRFKHLKNTILALGAIPIIAIPVFAAAVSTAREAPVTTPAAVRVVFADTPETRKALADEKLPSACAGRQISAIAVGGTLSKPVVVSDAVADCKIDRKEITPELGIAIPLTPR